MNRVTTIRIPKCFVRIVKVAAGVALGLSLYGAAIGADKSLPNILWIVVDDMSCDFGYQGQTLVNTPHVDRLAKEGVIFSNAYVTAAVCSSSRTAMITGMYQTSIGAHNHPSGRGVIKQYLPEPVRMVPELLKEAGYYLSNSNISFERFGKTDYDFVWDQKGLYDAPDWSGRKTGQPFFAQVQLFGGKYRNIPQQYARVKKELDDLVTPDQVSIPPYYPDDPVFRKDWAEYLNSVQYTDWEVGRIIQRLKDDGLFDNTIIFFMTDHGISQARGKQFLYEEGVKIPFVVWAPGRIDSGTTRDELIEHIDMAASSLYFAGIDIPEYMQARPLFGPQAQPREYVVSARDRCDETVDRIRSIRKGNYKYIRNFYPKRPYLQPSLYKDKKPFMAPLRKLYAEGKLNAVQSLIMAETRPEEELYYLSEDPWEIRNLADDPKHLDKLREMRGILSNWIIESDDQGRFPESEAAYDSQLKGYLESQVKRGRTEAAKQLQANIDLMKQWKAEGR
jgi:arylsulfatase A-like enzyme